MLSGKLAIEKADNGWIIAWYEKRQDFTVTVDEHREVYEDARDLLSRVAGIIGATIPEEHRAPNNPAIDPDVAGMIPENAPPSAYTE